MVDVTPCYQDHSILDYTLHELHMLMTNKEREREREIGRERERQREIERDSETRA